MKDTAAKDGPEGEQRMRKKWNILVTVTTILIGTRISAIFQEPLIRARAVGNVPPNFQMCLTIRMLISTGGRAAGTLRAACVSWYLFQDHICSCFYLLLRSSCIRGIINCKINSYSLTWKCNLLVSYRTGCLLMHIYCVSNFPLYPIYHLWGPKFITPHVAWAKTLKIMLSSSEKI